MNWIRLYLDAVILFLLQLLTYYLVLQGMQSWLFTYLKFLPGRYRRIFTSPKILSQISILNYYVQHNSHSIAVSTLTKTYKNLKRPSLATANVYSNASLYIMSRLISISWPNFTQHNLKAASSSKLEEGTQ